MQGRVSRQGSVARVVCRPRTPKLSPKVDRRPLRRLNAALDRHERVHSRFSPFCSRYFRPGLKYINCLTFRDLSAVNDVKKQISGIQVRPTAAFKKSPADHCPPGRPTHQCVQVTYSAFVFICLLKGEVWFDLHFDRLLTT